MDSSIRCIFFALPLICACCDQPKSEMDELDKMVKIQEDEEEDTFEEKVLADGEGEAPFDAEEMR